MSRASPASWRTNRRRFGFETGRRGDLARSSPIAGRHGCIGRKAVFFKARLIGLLPALSMPFCGLIATAKDADGSEWVFSATPYVWATSISAEAELIPTCINNHRFDRDDFCRRLGAGLAGVRVRRPNQKSRRGLERGAVVRPHFKRPATRPAAKSTRPSVARLDAPDALRRLPDGHPSRCATRLPGATIHAIKWVIISAIRY